ncbi:MAG: hypothetical protein EAS52_00825 [Parapedobacter sp.]|nr:MAG: hypothetical protein EAS52_00825 [Parapedobacter sp.]
MQNALANFKLFQYVIDEKLPKAVEQKIWKVYGSAEQYRLITAHNIEFLKKILTSTNIESIINSSLSTGSFFRESTLNQYQHEAVSILSKTIHLFDNNLVDQTIEYLLDEYEMKPLEQGKEFQKFLHQLKKYEVKIKRSYIKLQVGDYTHILKNTRSIEVCENVISKAQDLLPTIGPMSPYDTRLYTMESIKSYAKKKLKELKDYAESRRSKLYEEGHLYQVNNEASNDQPEQYIENFSDLFLPPYDNPEYIDKFIKILAEASPQLITNDKRWVGKKQHGGLRRFLIILSDYKIINWSKTRATYGRAVANSFKSLKPSFADSTAKDNKAKDIYDPQFESKIVTLKTEIDTKESKKTFG